MPIGIPKYHIIFIYYIDENGFHGGGDFADFFKLMRSVQGETRQDMIEQDYESLIECVENEPIISFD